MALGTLLVSGLIASGQINAQEAEQLTRTVDMTTITLSLPTHGLDWLAASEASEVSVDDRGIEAASCATSSDSRPNEALQARAFMQAVGRAARMLDLAIGGREQLRDSELLTVIDERAVARLSVMEIKEQIGFKHGGVSVACVLVSGESR